MAFNMNNEIAEHLEYQAHHLWEISDEHPERKAMNDAAAEEVSALAVLFRNDDTDADTLQEFTEVLGEIDFATSATQAYQRALDDVGFGSHYETAEEFLEAAIIEMKPRMTPEAYDRMRTGDGVLVGALLGIEREPTK